MGIQGEEAHGIVGGQERERGPWEGYGESCQGACQEDSQSSRSLSQEEEVINRYKAPRRTLAGRRGLSGNTLFSP